ncbi:MAG: hypothetical protein OEZ30_04250, partial [Candidatus Aminicenantes bacterium]|nr:hypothetical protein [Candidatus Aminicenantes bacterium]
LFFVGIEGAQLSEEERKWLSEFSPGGILLLPRNIKSPHQLFTLCQELKTAASPPPFIAIDQEGGIVDRLSPFTPSFPSNLALGATGNAEYSHRQGTLTARLLKMLGINLNLAPVVDLLASRDNNGIGIRAFGSQPELVIELSRAYLRGLKEEGVLGTLKHFPGLGRASVDPHSDLPVIEANKETLWEQDISVFSKLSHYSAFIMVGHAVYPSLVSVKRRPASLSTEIASDLLKRALDYKGLVITDDLEMGAISNFTSLKESTVQAVKSGNDMVMFSSPGRQVMPIVSHLCAEMEQDPQFARVVSSSVQKILAIKNNLSPGLIPTTLQQEELTELFQEIDILSHKIAEDSIVEMPPGGENTIQAGTKPVVFYPQVKPLLTGFSKGSSIIGGALKPFCPEFVEESYPVDNPFLRKDAFPSRQIAIIFTYNAHWHPRQEGFMQKVQEHFPSCFHISLGLPEDLKSSRFLRSLAAFSPTPSSIRAALRVLWGELYPRGKLPIR